MIRLRWSRTCTVTSSRSVRRLRNVSDSARGTKGCCPEREPCNLCFVLCQVLAVYRSSCAIQPCLGTCQLIRGRRTRSAARFVLSPSSKVKFPPTYNKGRAAQITHPFTYFPLPLPTVPPPPATQFHQVPPKMAGLPSTLRQMTKPTPKNPPTKAVAYSVVVREVAGLVTPPGIDDNLSDRPT